MPMISKRAWYRTALQASGPWYARVYWWLRYWTGV